MTTGTIVAVIAADVLSIVACAKIGATKGRLGQGMYGLLLGPVGVAVVALLKPAAGGGPEGDDFSRLAWLRGDGKPWTQRSDWLAAVAAVAVAATAFVMYERGPKGTVDGFTVSSAIQDELSKRLTALGLDGASLAVTCPDAPLQAGEVFDCTMTGYPQGMFTHVRVTLDDTAGHFHFEPY
jgi:hypothetical protein